MFKLSLSKYGIDHKQLNEALLSEFLTRQVTWAKGKDPHIRNAETSLFVKRFMDAAGLACQFFLVQFETTKLMINDSVRVQLEEGYGVVNQITLDHFMKKVHWIRDHMKDDWKVLIDNIGLEDRIQKEKDMQDLLGIAFEREDENYSFDSLRCSESGLALNNPKCPGFGHRIITYPNYILDPNVVCNLVDGIEQSTWLPLYVNKTHFKRVENNFESHIVSIFKAMRILNKGKYGEDTNRIAIKVFSHTLTHIVEKLSVEKRVQINMLKVYMQVLWTFWNVLQQNYKMRQYLDEEVELFRTDEFYRRNMSWMELREFAVRFILSENTRGNIQLWYCLLEELARKEAASAVGTLLDWQDFDCEKFGKSNQEQIKLILVQILLTKVILQEEYRVSLEIQRGNLRKDQIEMLKQDSIEIYKQRRFELWRSTIQVFGLQEIIKNQTDMSNLTIELYCGEIENTYWAFEDLKCSVSGLTLYHPKCPGFGYKITNYMIDPNVVCNQVDGIEQSNWLPLYVNKIHFERRVKSSFNAHLISIFRNIEIVKKGEYIDATSQIAIKVFTSTLVSIVEKLSVRRRVQMNMLIAYLQVLWTFWNVLDQDCKIGEYLDKEVELFRTSEPYRRNMSWLKLREFTVRFILSQKTRGNPELWRCLFEELVKKQAASAIENLGSLGQQGFDCQKFGNLNQKDIKLILVQILLTKVVLQSENRAQLEINGGNLKRHQIQELKHQIIGIYNQQDYNIWKPTIKVFYLDIIKGPEDMTALCRGLYERMVESRIEKLGFKIIVKPDKKKAKKANVAELDNSKGL